MFEVDGKIYELKYNMQTLERIEQATGQSIAGLFNKSQGLLSISEIKIYFGMALFNEQGNRVGQKQAMDIAEELMMAEGYMKINEAIIVALNNDCPFLFQAD